jgi:hypothetical protein
MSWLLNSNGSVCSVIIFLQLPFQVIVHLLDGNTADGHYLYHQEHYDLAFFKVRVDEEVEVPHFSASMHCGQDVFRLGRDDHMNLRITHGRVEYLNPGSYERHHYMHFFHQKNDFLSHQRNDDHLPDKRNDDYLVLLLNSNFMVLQFNAAILLL